MKIKSITKNLQPVLVMGAGAVGASYASKLIPFGNDKIKSGLTLLVGLALSGQKGAVGQFGTGMAVGGVQKLAGSFGIGGGDFINGIEDARFINGIEDLTAGGTIGEFNYNQNDSYGS